MSEKCDAERIVKISVMVVDGRVLYIHETAGDFNIESDVKLVKWNDSESEQLEKKIIELIKELSFRHPYQTFTYSVE